MSSLSYVRMRVNVWPPLDGNSVAPINVYTKVSGIFSYCPRRKLSYAWSSKNHHWGKHTRCKVTVRAKGNTMCSAQCNTYALPGLFHTTKHHSYSSKIVCNCKLFPHKIHRLIHQRFRFIKNHVNNTEYIHFGAMEEQVPYLYYDARQS